MGSVDRIPRAWEGWILGVRERVLRAPCFCPSSWVSGGTIYCGEAGLRGENEFGSVNFHMCVNFEMSVRQLRVARKHLESKVRAQQKRSIQAGSSFDISENPICFFF